MTLVADTLPEAVVPWTKTVLPTQTSAKLAPSVVGARNLVVALTSTVVEELLLRFSTTKVPVLPAVPQWPGVLTPSTPVTWPTATFIGSVAERRSAPPKPRAA